MKRYCQPTAKMTTPANPAQAVMAFLPSRAFRFCAFASLLAAFTVFALLCASPGYAQSVALTFDDGFDATNGNTQAARDNASVLATLKKQGVRAMLFPAGQLADHDENLELVRHWGEAGHAIGNHTYSHEALSKSDTTRYLDDVRRAHELLHALPGWCPRLRFPYLDEGKDQTQHSQAIQWLAQHGYGVAPVTIALSDWEYAQRYEDLLQSGSDQDASAFRQRYVELIGTQAHEQDVQWQAQVHRSPAHVLLLHTNRLNAAVLPDLLQWFTRHGWSFTDPLTAFGDPIYQRGYTNAEGSSTTLPQPACR